MEMTARGAGRIISSTERAAAHFVKRMASHVRSVAPLAISIPP